MKHFPPQHYLPKCSKKQTTKHTKQNDHHQKKNHQTELLLTVVKRLRDFSISYLAAVDGNYKGILEEIAQKVLSMYFSLHVLHKFDVCNISPPSEGVSQSQGTYIDKPPAFGCTEGKHVSASYCHSISWNSPVFVLIQKCHTSLFILRNLQKISGL